MNKALSLCDKAMYGALLLLVIFVPYSSVMIETGLLIMMTGWLVKRSLIWKSKPQQGFLTSFSLPYLHLQWPLLLIGALILFTLPFSHAPALTLKKFFSRFLQQTLLMYLVLEIVNTPKRLYQVMAMLLWTLAVVNADIFVQYFCGHSFIFSSGMIYQRVSGPMRHPNDLGTLLVTVLPVVLSLLITSRFWMPQLLGPKLSGAFKIITGSLFVLLVISLGLSSSRGAWLAFALTMVGFSFCLGKRWLTGLVISMLVLFFLIFGIHFLNVRTDVSPEILSSEEIVENQHNNWQIPISQSATQSEKAFLNSSRRYEYWHVALEVIKRYPIFGCGYNTYIQTLLKLQMVPVEYPHSSLFQITAELGVVGLLAHLWLFSSLLIYGIKTLKTISPHGDLYILGVGLCFGILAWLIHSVTDTAWESLQLSILWWLLIGLLVTLVPISKQLSRGGRLAGRQGSPPVQRGT